MKNNLFRYLTLITILLAFGGFTSAQQQPTEENPEVIQGCFKTAEIDSEINSKNIKDIYSAKKIFIWSQPDERGKSKPLPVNIIKPSNSNFVFTFKPEQVFVTVNKTEENKKGLLLKVFPFGREAKFEQPALENSEALNNLKSPTLAEFEEKRKNPNYRQFKISEVREEKHQPLYWDQKYLKDVKFTGVMRAIIREAKINPTTKLPDNFDITETTNEKGEKIYIFNEKWSEFFLPIESIENHPKIARPFLPTRFYYKDEKADTPPNLISPLDYDNRKQPESLNIKQITELKPITQNESNDKSKLYELNTFGLDTGFYWVTLQGNVTFSNGESCEKTTPPVLIEVRPPPTPPTVALSPPTQDVIYNVPKDEVTRAAIKATISGKPPFKLTWYSSSSDKIDVSNCNKNGLTDYESECIPVIYKNKLRHSETIEVTASVIDENGTGNCSDNNKCAELKIIIILPTGTAGVTFFGFATPNIKVNSDSPENSEPENWTKDITKQTRPDGPYPSENSADYSAFYEEYKKIFKEGEVPPIVGNYNRDTIKRVAKKLIEYPELNLYIYGYADIEKTCGYDNNKLAQWRINVVLDALKKEIDNQSADPKIRETAKNRINDRGILNCGDRSYCGNRNALSDNRKNKWANPRRWDRRVELHYTELDKSLSLEGQPAACVQPPRPPRKQQRSSPRGRKTRR
ncbi:MAG TPA: hypothetical protein VGB02_14180 [Pyrinomonadaceae bacterium]|jgi:hypothetical protein